VGWSSSGSERYLVAIGFKAWGITNGTAAGMMLADLATGKTSRWLDLFEGTRVKPIAGGAKFVQENVGVAKHLIGGYLASKLESCKDLKPGTAAILKIESQRGCLRTGAARSTRCPPFAAIWSASWVGMKPIRRGTAFAMAPGANLRGK